MTGRDTQDALKGLALVSLVLCAALGAGTVIGFVWVTFGSGALALLIVGLFALFVLWNPPR